MHDVYDPLEGREGHQIGGNAFLNLKVEGISYDEPEVKPKLSEFWYKLLFSSLPIIFAISYVLFYIWLGNWDYSAIISLILILGLGVVCVRSTL